MGTQHALLELGAALEKARRIVVVSHYSPDVDAYGSQCGLALALESQPCKDGGRRSVSLVNESGIVDKYRFVPGVARIQNQFPGGEWDLLVMCDCGDRKRVGDSLLKGLDQFAVTMNIDHHISNDHFASFNHVDAAASSTAELIVRLLDTMGITPTVDVATCLLAGIMGDTGSFRYRSTHAETFRVAARLVDAGASPADIATQLFSTIQPHAAALHAEVILGIRYLSAGSLGVGVASPELMRKHKCDANDVEGLVERIRDVAGVQVAVLMYWDNDIWRVSLRTKNGAIDASRVAQAFGGGGHKAAAAFRWRREYSELEVRLIEALTEELAQSGALKGSPA